MKTDLKRLRDYKIRIFEHGQTMNIKGYKVFYDDFPGFEFFVHRNHTGSLIWEVSEKTTGYLVTTEINHDRKNAIKSAHGKLEEKGIDKLREVVKTVIEQYGVLNENNLLQG